MLRQQTRIAIKRLRPAAAPPRPRHPLPWPHANVWHSHRGRSSSRNTHDRGSKAMAMYQAQIQAKYNKATEAYGLARGILDEHGDKPMDAEKSAEFDKAMAAFDGFVAEAKR